MHGMSVSHRGSAVTQLFPHSYKWPHTRNTYAWHEFYTVVLHESLGMSITCILCPDYRMLESYELYPLVQILEHGFLFVVGTMRSGSMFSPLSQFVFLSI